MKTILLIFAIAALAVASAAENYTLTFFQPSYVAGTELKAGDYELIVSDGHVVFKRGRKEVEAEAEVETAETEFKSTTVSYKNSGGKYHVSEIRLGGTNRKLVFN